MVILTASAQNKMSPGKAKPTQPPAASKGRSSRKLKDGANLKQTIDPMFHKVAKRLEILSSNYDQFIQPDSTKSDEFKELTKSLYEHEQTTMKAFDPLIATKARPQAFKPLSNLFVKGFDNEQIWQQLEVFNKPFLGQLVSEISTLSSRRATLSLNLDTTSSQKTENKKLSKSILKAPEEKPLPDKASKKDKKNKKVKFVKEDQSEPVYADDDDHQQLNNNEGNPDFFNLDEMEAFLDAEDRKEMLGVEKPKDNEEDEEIDMFAEVPSDSEDEEDSDEENGKDAMYRDFFDLPKSAPTTTIEEVGEEDDDEEEDEADYGDLDTRDFDANDFGDMSDEDDERLLEAASSDEDEHEKLKSAQEEKFNSITQKLKALANENLNANPEDNDPSKSEYEKSQLKLRRKIEKAERELLHPSGLNWQLAGETTGEVRPENSLLEEHLQFDHTSKPALMITDKTTLSLEGIIKQRIKDKVFDDVERKEKPNEKPFEFRRRILLESEKSKVGLAEVYEKEFLKKQQELKDQEGNSSMFAVAGEVEETETRKEVRRLMRGLFRKLDSLSAFHYTPRAPEPEVKIISNMPAISVEEVTPDTVSDMKLLAPEEVFSTRGKKVLQAKEERTGTDRKRAHRLKKKKQSIKQKLETKTQSKASSVNKLEIAKLKRNKNVSTPNEKNNTDKKAFSSSTKFFERLQESKEAGKVQKRQKANPKGPSMSKKLKL